MANRFEQFVRPSTGTVSAEPAQPANRFEPLAPPPEVVPEPANEPELASATETWSTRVGKKVISWEAPRGATKEQVQELAAAAGVPDPKRRSLKFGNFDNEKRPGQHGDANVDDDYGTFGTMLQAGADFVFPVVDEIASGLNAGYNALVDGSDYMKKYLENMRFLEDKRERSVDRHPVAAGVGDAAMVGLTLPMAVGSNFLNGGNLLLRSAKAASVGAPLAAANAIASNPVDDRMNGVPLATAAGATVAGAIPGVSTVVGKTARRVDQKFGVSEAASSAWRRITGRGSEEASEAAADRAAVNALAERTGQDPNTMRANAERFREVDQDPALVNVVDESGRGVIGALARRSGPGRDAVERAATAKALNMPDQLDRNMQRGITEGVDDPAVARQMQRPSGDLADDLAEVRSTEIEAAMEPIRKQQVPLSQDLVEILATPEGRTAIGRAARTVKDPATRAALVKLPQLLKEVAKIDPRMPPAVRQQITDAIMKDGGLTVDMADRLARKFGAMAKGADDDAAPVLRDFARTIRDHAKDSSPDYALAMETYGTRSKGIKAIETGESVLVPNSTDDFVEKAAGLSDETNVVPVISPDDQIQEAMARYGDEFAGSGGDPSDVVAFNDWLNKTGRIQDIATVRKLPSDRQLAQVGARRAVQRAVGENTAAAPGVARKMAYAPEQRARNNVLFGETRAADIENAMAISADDVRHFADINPRTGSQTAIRGSDDAVAGEILQAVATAKSGNILGAATMALNKLGMRDKDVARVLEMAVDPNRTDELIDMMEAYFGSRERGQAVAQALSQVGAIGAAKQISGSR